MNKDEKIAKAREEFTHKAGAFYKAFSTPDGERVLGILEDEFHNRTSIVPNDPYATHAHEGAREVVLFIKQMMEMAENE